MAETYSLAVTAARAHNPFYVKNVTLPDSAAKPGHQAGAMATGKQLLCQRADGSQGYFTIDAERSDPARGLIYVLPVA